MDYEGLAEKNIMRDYMMKLLNYTIKQQKFIRMSQIIITAEDYASISLIVMKKRLLI